MATMRCHVAIVSSEGSSSTAQPVFYTAIVAREQLEGLSGLHIEPLDVAA